ncbi:hypothetical protein MTO96_004012 [Rhipicephalus appendiculatus]
MDDAAEESAGRSGKKMKSSLAKNRPPSTARAEDTGALGRAQRGFDENSGTGVSPVGQASVIPTATDGNAFGSKLRAMTGPAAGTDVAAKVASIASTTEDRVPLNKDASKAPNAPGVLDTDPRAELTATDVPSAHGRSRKKRRKFGAKLLSSSSSASSASSRTSKQGATEGERKGQGCTLKVKEGAPVPKTRDVGAGAPPDGKADNIAVVAGTLANEGTASQQWYGSAPSMTTGASHGSEDEKPFSTTTARADSAGAALDLASGASAGREGHRGGCSVGWLPTPSCEGEVVADRGSVQPPKALPEQQETSQPVPASRTVAGKPDSTIGRPSLGKATDESGASEVHAVSTRGAQRSSIVSPGWSFYPLNVTFVTERDTKQECFLYGSMICASAVVFSVLVAVLVTAFFPNRARTPLACLTPECVAARDYLAGLINFSRDACGDFYGYVCSSWIGHRSDGGSFRGDSVAASLDSINESLWRKNDAEGDSPDLRLMHHIYQGCHAYVSERSSKAAFRATLESARKLMNWSAIRGSRDYHVLVTLLVRTSLLVGFHTVLVTELFSENDRTVLRFSCGRSLLRKLSMAGRRIDLHAALQTVVRDEAKDIPRVLEVEELVGHKLDGPDCSADIEDRDIAGPLSQFVGGIVPGVNASAWAEAVQDVLVTSGENASQLSDIAVASGVTGFRRVLLDVVSAGGVGVSALYLATHLDLEIAYLELSRWEVRSDSEGTARFCVALSRRPLVLSWPWILARILGVRESHEVLRGMFDQIKATAPATTMFAWLPEVTRRAAEEKIGKVNLTLVSEDMSIPYASLIADWDERRVSFVMFFVKAMSISYALRVRSPPTWAQLVVSHLEERHEVAYSSTTSSIVVPTLYQHAPHLYATGVPSQFNYATVGAVLATRIVDVVAPSPTTEAENESFACPFWRAFRRERPGTQKSGGRGLPGVTTTPAPCACSGCTDASDLRYRAIGGNSGERLRRDMFLRAQGLRLAYDALVASMGPLASNRYLRTLWHEARMVFFIRFCLLYCDADQRLKPTLSSRAKCLLPLHNMPEFGAVFDCVSREDFVTEQCVA